MLSIIKYIEEFGLMHEPDANGGMLHSVHTVRKPKKGKPPRATDELFVGPLQMKRKNRNEKE